MPGFLPRTAEVVLYVGKIAEVNLRPKGLSPFFKAMVLTHADPRSRCLAMHSVSIHFTPSQLGPVISTVDVAMDKTGKASHINTRGVYVYKHR